MKNLEIWLIILFQVIMCVVTTNVSNRQSTQNLNLILEIFLENQNLFCQKTLNELDFNFFKNLVLCAYWDSTFNSKLLDSLSPSR